MGCSSSSLSCARAPSVPESSTPPGKMSLPSLRSSETSLPDVRHSGDSEGKPEEEVDFEDALSPDDFALEDEPLAGEPETPLSLGKFPLKTEWATSEEAVKTHQRLANSWVDPPTSLFQVRGPHYLETSGTNKKDLKQPSAEAPYTVIGLNMLQTPGRVTHVSAEIGPYRRDFESRPADEDQFAAPKFLVVNWILSGLFDPTTTIVSHVFRRTGPAKGADPALDVAFERFLRGTDAEKNKKFKYVFRVVSSPAAFQNTVKALGGERPVLIGQRLTTTYFRGRNHLEINMYVSSSRIASLLNGIVLKNSDGAVVDLSWLLEGQQVDELPERILAKCRWCWALASDVVVAMDEHGEMKHAPASA
jgi:hypothetical protein